MQHFKYYIPGVSLVLMAGLIIAVPEILVAIISVFIFTTGIFVLFIGHGMRKYEMESARIERRFRTFDWHKYCFYK